jgi:hypothetical protein
MMSTFDVAFGVNASTLDKGVGQLYAKPEVRNKLFKGSKSESTPLGTVTLSWDILAAPNFILEPPSDDQWQKAQKKQAGGKDVPKPALNGFQVHFPQFNASYSIDGKPGPGGTTDLYVYASVTVQDDPQGQSAGIVTLSVAGIGLNESYFSKWDKFIFNKILLPQIFSVADQMLSALKINGLSYEGVKFAHPTAIIANSMLVAAAVLDSKSATDLNGAVWPQKSLFVLFSADLAQVAADTVTKQFDGVNKSGDGDYKGLASYKYSATLNHVKNTITPRDLPKIQVQISGQASGSCSLLGCPIGSASAFM